MVDVSFQLRRDDLALRSLYYEVTLAITHLSVYILLG